MRLLCIVAIYHRLSYHEFYQDFVIYYLDIHKEGNQVYYA